MLHEFGNCVYFSPTVLLQKLNNNYYNKKTETRNTFCGTCMVSAS